MVTAKIFAIIIFILMFALIIMDKIPRQWVTLGCGLATIVIVFGICMRSPSAIMDTLNVKSIFTAEFWHVSGNSTEESSGINWATIIFIAGMMVMVEGMAKAGFFRWLCLTIAKAVKYKVMPILVTFMIMSAVLSMFIDSITVILFLAAVTVELSHLLKFDPVPMILSEIFCANLGGAATMCGDPPNIIIGTSLGYTFFDFIENTGAVVAICFVFMLIYFTLCFRKELERGGEKQHDRDAVDEHRQKRRERHKADEQRHRAVVYELGKRQAQPAEKARLAEALDHDHHAGDKQDRRPVDASGALLTCAVPECALEKRAEVERLPNGAHRAHADAEHQHEHERAAPERNVMPFKLIEDNKQEHSDKNADGNDLSKHVIPPCAVEFPARVIISVSYAEAKCYLDMEDMSFFYAVRIFLISCGFSTVFTFRQGSVLFSRIRLRRRFASVTISLAVRKVRTNAFLFRQILRSQVPRRRAEPHLFFSEELAFL